MNKEIIFWKLEEWGCDVDGALERFLRDEELYVTCLYTVAADPNFEELGIALREKNIEQSFDFSHTLKGVFLNMGLKPMFTLIEQIVEPLRQGSSENLWNVYEELLESKNYLNRILGCV